MNYNKYTKPQRGLDKKKIIMIILVITIIVGAGIGLFIRFSSYDKKVEEETVIEEIDTSITGDASIDPENEEIKEETGESVDSNDLKEEQGKSNGIDVSKWQGKINWSKVKNSHIDFAFIRIGYRGEDGKIYKDDKLSHFYTTTADGYKLKFIVPNDGVELSEIINADTINKINIIFPY